MKKIVFLINSAYPNISGGRETWLFNILEYLSANDYKSIVISRKRKSSQKLFFTKQKSTSFFQIYSIEKKKSALKMLNSLIYFCNVIIYLLCSIFCLIFLLIKKELKNDIVIVSMNPGFECIPAIILKKFFEIPYICSVRGNWSSEIINETSCNIKSGSFNKICEKFLTNLESFSLEQSTVITANGLDTLNRLKNNVKNPIYLIPNGVNIKKYLEIDRVQLTSVHTFCITSVASLRDIKGIPQIIQAIPGVVKHLSSVKFLLVGKGNPQKYLDQAIELNIKQYIEFSGERADIPEILHNSDIVLCLSGGSGLSHSLLEAMAAKKPIIAWNTPVYNQIIKNNYNGILIENGDIESLSKGIVNLINNQNLKNKISENAFRDVQKFDWKIVSSQFEELIESI